MTTANCPSCGAPIEFAIGSSAVVVCGYCRTLAARKDRAVESHGISAELLDALGGIRVGSTGRFRGKGFRVTGRTRMKHQAGGFWDEWYAAFDDGRWGWLAEAQGRFYITFEVAAEAPSVDSIEIGATLFDGFVVSEIGRAEVVAAEGELPWTPDIGGRYAYADLTGPAGRFATIDYSGEPPVVFKGSEVTLPDLGIEGGGAAARRTRVEKLSCSQCAAPLDLKAPEAAERIFCPNCGAGHDITQGSLRWFQTLRKKKVSPVIPLGTKGTIDGDEYVIAGFMERSVRFDRDYFWTEYLLHNPSKGFRWLVHSDGHWSFVTPLRPGDVQDLAATGVAKMLVWEGRTFKLFQDALAKVTYVVGEFYWKVEVGETVETSDYIAPPFGISKEITRTGAREVNYSHARYMEIGEVEESFGVAGLPRRQGIAPMQPFGGARLGKSWALMLALLILAAMVVGVMKPKRTLLETTLDLAGAAPAEGAPANVRVLFTEPMQVSGQHNLAVAARSSVTNSWVYVAADLVNESTGKMESFELPIEYYEGVDGGERWTEGSRSKRVYISRPDAGKYALRIEAQWPENATPPAVQLTVREGLFRWPHFLLALLAISIIPVIALFRQLAFETERWKESAHSPYGQTGDEEDDE